jgi:tetratricopeptide (TPR) repeat protein
MANNLSEQNNVKNFKKNQPFVDRFIGREKYIAIIDEALADQENRYLIPFLAKGGTGKTALLREVYKRNSLKDNVIVIQLDYSQTGFQSMSAIANNIVTQILDKGGIPQQSHEEYLRMAQKGYDAFRAGASKEEVTKLAFSAYNFLIQKMNNELIITNKRLLVISDSVEATTDISMGLKVNELASDFSNAVIVIAGRPTDIVIGRFVQEFNDVYEPKGWIVKKPINLSYFTEQETRLYLKKTFGQDIDIDIVQKVHLLTDGKPVLLAITSEWLTRHVDLPSDVDLPLHLLQRIKREDEERFTRIRHDFEMQLIDRVRVVTSPIDEALLKMAFLDRRYDKQILKLVLQNALEDLEGEKLDAKLNEIENELGKISFVRSLLEDEHTSLIHDEAKELIKLYAWRMRDPKGTERKSLIVKIIDEFYLPEIKKYRNSIRQQVKESHENRNVTIEPKERYLVAELEVECLFYHYRLSLRQGREYLTQLLSEELTVLKREAIWHELFNQVENENEAMIAMARMDLKGGVFEDANKIKQAYKTALSEKNTSYEYQMDLLYELSDLPEDPAEKDAYLQKALGIAKENDDQERIGIIYNDIGLMYRKQGDWKQAEVNYEHALKIAKSYPALKASTLNNLAYAKLLNGERDIAGTLIDIALQERVRQGNQIGIAYSYQTKAFFYDSKGEIFRAKEYYQDAANIFYAQGREKDHAKVLVYLAEIQRIDHLFDEAEKLLEKALQLPPSEAKALAERELGLIYRKKMIENKAEDRKKTFAHARKHFQNSLKVCQKTRDKHGQIQAFLDLSLLNFWFDKSVVKQEFENLSRMLEKNKQNFPLLYANFLELQGDINYSQGDFEKAFEDYLSSAKILSQRHLRKFNAMFDRFRERVFELEAGTQSKLCDFFSNYQKNLRKSDVLNSALQGLCVAIKIAF